MKRFLAFFAVSLFNALPALGGILPQPPLQGEGIEEGVEATLAYEFDLANPEISTRAVTPGAIYSNQTTFSGSGVTPDGVTATSGTRVTRMLADDILFAPGTVPGTTITQFTFCVANFNAAAFAAQPYVRFYDDAAGTPGTFRAGFNFNAITFPALSVGCYFFNVPVANQWTIPADLKHWAGMGFFITSGSAAATTSLNNLGTGLFNPVDVGSSADLDFLTTANGGSNTSAFAANNPAGSVRISPYAAQGRIANHGWEFLPEPSSAALLAMAGLALIRRRR